MRAAAAAWSLPPLLLLAQLAAVRGQGCAADGSKCICTDAEGDEWDLTELSGLKTVIGPPQSSLYGEWQYNFDLCATVTPPAPPLCSSVTTTIAYRIEDYEGTGALCHQLGPESPAGLAVTKLTPGSSDDGVRVTFTHATYTLNLDIQCDPSKRGADTMPAPPADGSASVTMVWETFYSCPAHQSGGSSWGTPFLIIVCVAGVMYAGGGYYYNHRQKGLNGKEALPHVDFWTQDLPLAVTDGIHFTRMELSSRVKYLEFLRPAGGKSYSNVDEEAGSGNDSDDSDKDSDSSDEPAKKPLKKKKVVPPKKTRSKVDAEPIE